MIDPALERELEKKSEQLHRRTAGRRLRWKRVECVICEGCGFTANDDESTPWSRIRAEFDPVSKNRPRLRPLLCIWCSGLGWVAQPMVPVEVPE